MLTIIHEHLFVYRVGGAQTALKMSMSVWLTLHCVITNRTLSVLTHPVHSRVYVGQVSMKSTENVWVCIIIMSFRHGNSEHMNKEQEFCYCNLKISDTTFPCFFL